MNLKHATFAAILAICYYFLLRTVGTLLPSLFHSILIAQISQVLTVLSILSILLFFVFFYREFIPAEKIRLKQATVLAILGSAIMVVLAGRSLLTTFPKPQSAIYGFSPQLYQLVMSGGFQKFSTLSEWVNSLIILYFAVVLYHEIIEGQEPGFKRAALFAVIGSSISALIQSLSFLNYLLFLLLGWSPGLSRALLFVFLPVSLIGFAAMLYFLLFFYRKVKTSRQLN